MASSADIIKQLHKDHGKEIGGIVTKYEDLPRIPTGIFPLDLTIGGGIPMGKMTLIYGPESSGKTNLVYMTIVEGQRLYQEKLAVLIDAEHGHDPDWAKSLGVDLNRLIVIHPDYAEQIVDIAESFLLAEDVFLVALDSMAAMVTANESTSSADKVIVGGASLVGGKLVRKATRAMGIARKNNKNGFSPAFICINQIRIKIGVMFGDPETLSGGNAQKYFSSLTLRIYGKNVMDKKLHPVMPVYKDVSVIVKKWKMPILSVNSAFEMAMLPIGGHKAGYVNDWNTISTYLKELDYLTKGAKSGWEMFEEKYPTLEAARDFLYADPQLLHEAKQTIIKELLERGQIGAPDESKIDKETGEVLA